MSQQLILENGPYSMTIDPTFGARITAFCLNGQNCLTTSGPQIGSTFWPSPQESWGWPPPVVIDSEPYAVAELDDGVLLTSQPCPKTGLVVAKSIRHADQGFVLTFRMHNPTENPLRVAHWEISRVDGGLTFYQSDTQPLSQSDLEVEQAAGAFWHDYQPAGFDNNVKLFANGSTGWLANANKGLLLKKVFPCVSADKVAPGEAEVEIYAHGDPDNPYVEIEQQGEYLTIAPGASADWSVQWQLRAIDAGIDVSVGSSSLLKFAQAL